MWFAWLTLLPATGQIDVLASEDFPKQAQLQAICATVAVTNSATKITGSGVVVHREDGSLYLLTAHHVVKDAEEVDVALFTEKSYPQPAKTYGASVLASDPKQDLAVLRVLGVGAGVVAPIAKTEQAHKSKAFRALTVGCTNGPQPRPGLNTVLGKKTVRRMGEETSTFWQLKSPIAPGGSGGPLLDRSGRLIGIVSFSGEGHAYCATIEGIHDLLRAHGLRYLLGE